MWKYRSQLEDFCSRSGEVPWIKVIIVKTERSIESQDKEGTTDPQLLRERYS